MLTPVQYAERYRQIVVQANGQSRSVRVEIYRIGEPDQEQQVLWQKLKERFQSGKKTDPTFRLRLQVNAGEESFSSHEELRRRVVNPFWGKGSPEDCQITLEVALLLGRTTMEGVQEYARRHIGLDCNGFVGNYIWHVHQNHPWNSFPEDDVHPGPSANIQRIMKWVRDHGREIESVAEMHPDKMYVLGKLDSHLKVIPGGPGGPHGHIAITEPNRFMQRSFVFNSFGGLDLAMASKDAYGHPAYYAVESTSPEGKVGLRESWYALRPLKRANGQEIAGVFDVFRGSLGIATNFRIAELP